MIGLGIICLGMFGIGYLFGSVLAFVRRLFRDVIE